LLTRDDEGQFQKAYRVFQKEVFIPDTVILETEWVLRYAYEFEPIEIREGFRKLFGLKNVHCAQPSLIENVLNWHEQGMDFADAIHLALSQGCTVLKTFDQAFIKKAKPYSACVVSLP
jgi:predicted nucleic-acid-binding protein